MSELKTIFVTGASGYIAKHIVLQLLEGGYAVRGSVRSDAKGAEVRAAMAAHVSDAASLERLETVNLNLMSDDGWDVALTGADILMHTASPFPLENPKNEDELIRPAVDGTLRALKAAKAAGITRVVLTSSCASIMNTKLKGRDIYNEGDWSDVNDPHIRPYDKSKTLAEKAAWDFVDAHPEMQLTTINPSFVLGPGLDGNFGSSLNLMQRVVRAKDPAMPRLSFPIVDVRDIALMHIRAMEREAAIGHRFIGAAGSLWFTEIAQAMKDRLPDRKIVTRQAPGWLVKILAKFDPQIRGILPDLGREFKVDSSAAREVLGIDFIANEKSVGDSGAFLVDNGYD